MLRQLNLVAEADREPAGDSLATINGQIQELEDRFLGTQGAERQRLVLEYLRLKEAREQVKVGE